MRRAGCLVLTLLALALLCGPAFAAENSFEIDPEEGLPPELLDTLGEFDPTQLPDFGAGLLRLLGTALQALSGSFRSGLCSVGLMLAAVVLCSLLGELVQQQALRLIGVLAIAGAALGGMQSMIGLAADTLGQMREYSLILLPGIAGLSVFSGAATQGAAIYAGGVVFFDVLLRLSSSLVLPLVWLYAGASCADAALGDGRLGALSEFLKWIASGVLKWTGYLFTGYLAVTGILCGSVDAAQLRAARAALSAAVPVVGGIISEASDSLLAAASMLKSAVGIYGMLAVVAICMAPFLRIGLQLVLLKATAALSGLFGQPKLTELIGRLSEALGILLAQTGTFCAAALLCLALCMKATG